MTIETIHSQFTELSERLSITLDHLLQLKDDVEVMQEMAEEFFPEPPN